MIKNSFFVALLWVLLIGVAQAQSGNVTVPDAVKQSSLKERVEWASKEIAQRYGLTTEQSHSIKSALLQRAQSLEPLRASKSNDPKNYAAACKTAAGTFDQAIQKSLTPEQYTNYRKDNDAYAKEQQKIAKKTKTIPAHLDQWGTVLE